MADNNKAILVVDAAVLALAAPEEEFLLHQRDSDVATCRSAGWATYPDAAGQASQHTDF